MKSTNEALAASKLHHANLLELNNEIDELNKVCDVPEMIIFIRNMRTRLEGCKRRAEKMEVILMTYFAQTMENKHQCYKKLNLCHWNANGINKKSCELQHFIAEHNLDVVLLNETKLATRMKTPRIQGFDSYRRDRQSSNPGGGVLIYVKKDVGAVEILPDINRQMEVIGVQIGQMKLYSIYAPDNTLDASTLNQLLDSGEKVALLGDFNAQHLSWNCSGINSNGRRLFNYMLRNSRYGLLTPSDFTHFPYDQNKNPSVIDLAIVKNFSNSKISVLNDKIIILCY